MDYYCSNCKNKLELDIEVKFCPFCGKPYQIGDYRVNSDSLRITIGSDSERTIENKYWDASSECISRIKAKLQSQLLTLESKAFRRLAYIPIPEEFGEYISDGESDPPTRIRKYIKKIERTFDEIEKNPEQFRIRANQVQDWIDKERTLIVNTHKKLMDVVRFEEQNDYEDRLRCEKEQDDDEESIRINRYDRAKYNQLLQAIHISEIRIRKIIFDEDGSFNTPYAKSLPEEEAEECDPEVLSRELLELSEIDYDFIFGENPDQFILKFWDCIIYLAYVANEMLDDQYNRACTASSAVSYKEKIQCQIAALDDALSNYSDNLEIHLDKLYRSQRADMLEVQLSLVNILKECTIDGDL